MKTMKKLIIIILPLVLALTACEDLQELNKNPNNVSETHPQYLLTQAEWIAFQAAGADPLFATRMIVQTDGEQAEQYYTWDRGDFDDYGKLRTVVKMIEESQRIENTAYEALGKFFRAYYFYNLSLTFGDIPYSEAFKGESENIYTPVYDTQKEVFLGILQELEEANEMLTDDNSSIDGDIIYDGSTTQWRKLINSFRLKILLTLSKKTSDTDFNVESTFAYIYNNLPIMESLSDNGHLEFIDEEGSRYTEFNSSSYGSARYMDSTFVKRLQDREDPRLFIYCGQTKNAKEAGYAIDNFSAYEGGDPIAAYNDVNIKASEGNVSKVNTRYYTDPTNEPHMLLGYPELQFILAEAAVRGWISANPATLYENGIRASFEFYNTYAEDYAEYVDDDATTSYLQDNLVNFSNANSEDEQIEFIMMQKYFQSFMQSGWTMYFENLRTGYPGYITIEGVTLPTRWMYPNSEYLENSENVENAIASQFGEGNDDTREVPWWLK